MGYEAAHLIAELPHSAKTESVSINRYLNAVIFSYGAALNSALELPVIEYIL